jgi:hypothetical protein
MAWKSWPRTNGWPDPLARRFRDHRSRRSMQPWRDRSTAPCAQVIRAHLAGVKSAADHQPSDGAAGSDASHIGARVAAGAGLIGLGLLALAWRCNAAWFQRHVFLPYYFVAPSRGALWLRGATALLGVSLLAGGRALGRQVQALMRGAGGPGLWLGTLLALVAAVPMAEVALRLAHITWRTAGSARFELKIGHRDPLYGWIADASRLTRLKVNGRPYSYAVGPAGLRARGPTEDPDFDRSALVVTGESIASGYGLDYDETFAVRCGRALGLEVVDVAEGGYGVDQAYLRVAGILPRVRHPVALVMVFVANQLGRGLRDDRPRLALDGAGRLTFLPPAAGFLARTQLGQLINDRIPYAGDDALARSMALTRTVLVMTARAARSRGARPLFVVASPGHARSLDAHPEAAILRELFVETGLPYLLVDLDANERLDVDGHPNPAGASRMAAEIEAALRRPEPPRSPPLALP